jgi:SAM-dependent methyltransferase
MAVWQQLVGAGMPAAVPALYDLSIFGLQRIAQIDNAFLALVLARGGSLGYRRGMALADILQYPRIYQGFQSLSGFFGARIRAIDAYLDIKPGDHVIDIGCGPGTIVKHLPMDIRYDGFDIEKRYIEYARSRFHARGSFHCRRFDLNCTAFLGSADVVMMNGLLHHLDNADASALLRVVCRALKPTGVLFTLDGCFRDGQSWLKHWLLRQDRGRHVRTEDEYRQLLKGHFGAVEIFIREDLSPIPYSFVVGLAHPVSPYNR